MEKSGHGMNAMLIREEFIPNFEDWSFIEPQTITTISELQEHLRTRGLKSTYFPNLDPYTYKEGVDFKTNQPKYRIRESELSPSVPVNAAALHKNHYMRLLKKLK